MFYRNKFAEVTTQHFLFPVVKNLADGRVDGQQPTLEVVGADQGLAMIEQVTVSLFTKPDLFFIFSFLRDADHIDDDNPYLSCLPQYRANPMHEMLKGSIFIAGGFGPLHQVPCT